MGTVALVDELDLRPGLRVLDVGSGLEGTARYLARRTGLTERVTFCQGTATALPLPDDAVDRACMLHVGMNIADKATLFAEVRRVLVDGGLFGVYDVMRSCCPWPVCPSHRARPARVRPCLLPGAASHGRGRWAAASWPAHPHGRGRRGEGRQPS
ncbi:MAG: methyltransferase domain-containing protein [Streptosporangiaceae bacterium]|nr:methyltransferase domain-containing protein [Streptosporangiaceae bacterium]